MPTKEEAVVETSPLEYVIMALKVSGTIEHGCTRPPWHESRLSRPFFLDGFWLDDGDIKLSNFMTTRPLMKHGVACRLFVGTVVWRRYFLTGRVRPFRLATHS